jgi:hypothetical protein
MGQKHYPYCLIQCARWGRQEQIAWWEVSWSVFIIYWFDQIKKDEMGGSCCMHAVRNTELQNMKRRNHLIYLCIPERIILKCIRKERWGYGLGLSIEMRTEGELLSFRSTQMVRNFLASWGTISFWTPALIFMKFGLISMTCTRSHLYVF